MQLAQIQLAFSCALFDGATEPHVLPIFKGNAQKVGQRFALYRGNLTGSWNKTLSAAYPILHALVGDEFFSALSRQYGKTYPSREGDLNCFGAQFADFLTDFPHVAAYPYFPDMARLEWAIHRAHYAANAPSLSLAQVRGYSAERLDQARLSLRPACQIGVFDWAVVDIWLAHHTEAAFDSDCQLAQRSYGLIVRPEWQATVLPLTAAGYVVLSALHQMHTLGEALDAALEVDPEFDFATYWQQWLQHGVFVADLI